MEPQAKKRCFAVEVERTITERHTVFVSCVGDDDDARSIANHHADWEPIKTPWEKLHTAYDTIGAVEVDPCPVDIQA